MLKEALFLLGVLSDSIIVDELITVDALACSQFAWLFLLRAILILHNGLIVHEVPSALDAALSEQLHCQARHLTFLSDISTEIISLLLKHCLTLHIDNELITVELLDVRNSIVFIEEFPEAILNTVKLTHDLTSESLLALLVLPLEHNNEEFSHRLKLCVRHRLKCWNLAKLISLMSVLERNLITRIGLATDCMDHDSTIMGC